MAWQDIFTADDEETLLNGLGDDLLYYTSDSETTPIKALVDFSGDDFRLQDSFTTGTRMFLTALKSDVPGLARGSKFDDGGQTMVVDSITGQTKTTITAAVRYE